MGTNDGVSISVRLLEDKPGSAPLPQPHGPGSAVTNIVQFPQPLALHGRAVSFLHIQITGVGALDGRMVDAIVGRVLDGVEALGSHPPSGRSTRRR